MSMKTKCTGCGVCTEKCPSRKGLNAFNMGLNTRGAVYIPFAQAIPNVAVIDSGELHYASKRANAVCAQKYCSAGAIDYNQQDEYLERQYGAIIVATGFKPIDASAFDEFAYTQSKDVVTSLEFERIMNAGRPDEGTARAPVGRQASA